uniref:WW domain-binding protein n=1 Tax=Panagrellus redivivus TaxID=6233 RepID=A0A7E4V627_PANRE
MLYPPSFQASDINLIIMNNINNDKGSQNDDTQQKSDNNVSERKKNATPTAPGVDNHRFAMPTALSAPQQFAESQHTENDEKKATDGEKRPTESPKKSHASPHSMNGIPDLGNDPKAPPGTEEPKKSTEEPKKPPMGQAMANFSSMLMSTMNQMNALQPFAVNEEKPTEEPKKPIEDQKKPSGLMPPPMDPWDYVRSFGINFGRHRVPYVAPPKPARIIAKPRRNVTKKPANEEPAESTDEPTTFSTEPDQEMVEDVTLEETKSPSKKPAKK